MTQALLKLNKKIHENNQRAKALLEAVANGPETRDLNATEQAQFDQCMSDVTTLKGQVAQLMAIEANEDADADAAPSDAERSIPARRSRPIGEAPAVHTKKRHYSIHRALALASDQKPVDGLEGEISQEIAKRTGAQPKGFYMPTGQDPELRALMGFDPDKARAIRRDLTTTTGAGSIFTLPEEPLIDLLRAKLVVKQLGATVLTDMHGLFALPRKTGTATVYWLAEGNSATATNPALDQVTFSPKVAIAAVNISKMFMAQTSLDAEQFTKDDLASAMAHELDRVAICGTGAPQPTGITQIGAIQTASAALQGGTNGGAISYAGVVGLETLVAQANADGGKLAYLTSPAGRGVLKQTAKVGSTYPTFLWEDGTQPGVGEMNGYPAWTSTVVPANVTKGTGSNLTSLIFGAWDSLTVAQWEGADTVVNPFTNQLNGGVIVSVSMLVDVKVRHNESFAIISDATR